MIETVIAYSPNYGYYEITYNKVTGKITDNLPKNYKV